MWRPQKRLILDRPLSDNHSVYKRLFSPKRGPYRLSRSRLILSKGPVFGWTAWYLSTDSCGSQTIIWKLRRSEILCWTSVFSALTKDGKVFFWSGIQTQAEAVRSFQRVTLVVIDSSSDRFRWSDVLIFRAFRLNIVSTSRFIYSKSLATVHNLDFPCGILKDYGWCYDRLRRNA